MHILKLSFYIIGKRKTFVCVNWLVLKYQHALQYKPVCSSSVRQICTARLPFFSWYITNGFVIGDYSDWYNIMLRFPTYSIYMMYRMTPDTGISTTLIMCTAGTKSAQYISLTYLLGIIRLGGIAWWPISTTDTLSGFTDRWCFVQESWKQRNMAMRAIKNPIILTATITPILALKNINNLLKVLHKCYISKD